MASTTPYISIGEEHLDRLVCDGTALIVLDLMLRTFQVLVFEERQLKIISSNHEKYLKFCFSNKGCELTYAIGDFVLKLVQ